MRCWAEININNLYENIKELEDSGCLPITDGQLKAMAQRISETVYAILDQKYGSTSNLKLVRTKNSDRSMEDIILDPNPPKNIKIKLDDESSFSIFNPSDTLL